jgi:hypothetical protein
MEAIDALAVQSVTVGKVTVPHNTAPWRVATNRHPNLDRTDWGWIDGAPGNVCWSDNEAFNRAAAMELVRLHNQWLEDQKPFSIRLIEAQERRAVALNAYKEAKNRFDKAAAALAKCDEAISILFAMAVTHEPHPQAPRRRLRARDA